MKTITISLMVSIILAAAVCGAQDKSSTLKPPRANLHIAAIQGNMKAVQQHIAAGSDLNVKEPDVGSTPLISAITFGKTEVAKALIEAGADLNIKNNDGSTALITAAFFCRVEVLKLLLENGADISLTNNRGSSALATVGAPYERIKPIYEYIEKALKPLGFRLDYKRIKRTRPIIVELLKESTFSE
ncbi:ankyrin repeat domain-containing protein [bacterium]|nr:ankyrin repeat domain-containing protein [bacterium]